MPVRNKLRVMLSSQRLWPRSCRIRVALMLSPLWRPPHSISRPTRAGSVELLFAPILTSLAVVAERRQFQGQSSSAVLPMCMIWDPQPPRLVAREQAISGLGAGTAGGIIGKIGGRRARPGIEQALHRTPCCLDRVGPLKQSGVADQAIVDQRLVADRRQGGKIVAVGKVHFHPVDFDLGTGALGAEAE